MFIGITSNLVRAEGKIFSRLAEDYYGAIIQAGGVPIILPPVQTPRIISKWLELLDGLVISGAGDLPPSVYGEKLLPKTKPVLPLKQQSDLYLARLAWQKRIPTLAICYGTQLANVARGGTLFQDITTQLGLPSHRNLPQGGTGHRVYLSEDSLLYKIIRKPVIPTNSQHHQVIKSIGKNLKVTARSADGLIEGIETTLPHHFFIGVQWHPERMAESKEMQQLFRALVLQARYSHA